jgi:hypothetical protein
MPSTAFNQVVLRREMHEGGEGSRVGAERRRAKEADR